MALAGYQDAAFLFVSRASLQNLLPRADRQGDSITQACTAGSLFQRTAQFYLRRLDVINRGFGGEPLVWRHTDNRVQLGMVCTGRDLTYFRAIPVFETVFPKKDKRDSGCAQSVPLMTIWFGMFVHRPS